ncbi:MAG TPA: hypothetical protein VEI97_14780 [bacterium]|nr:hypothetical protein [bacterium]
MVLSLSELEGSYMATKKEKTATRGRPKKVGWSIYPDTLTAVMDWVLAEQRRVNALTGKKPTINDCIDRLVRAGLTAVKAADKAKRVPTTRGSGSET